MPSKNNFKHLRKKADEELKHKSNLPTDKEIAEYRRLGGSKTKAGRTYRRKWMEKHGG